MIRVYCVRCDCWYDELVATCRCPRPLLRAYEVRVSPATVRRAALLLHIRRRLLSEAS